MQQHLASFCRRITYERDESIYFCIPTICHARLAKYRRTSRRVRLCTRRVIIFKPAIKYNVRGYYYNLYMVRLYLKNICRHNFGE